MPTSNRLQRDLATSQSLTSGRLSRKQNGEFTHKFTIKYTSCNLLYRLIKIIDHSKVDQKLVCKTNYGLTLLLPNATVVEFTAHCQRRLQSKCKGTVGSCLFLTVISDTNLCSLFQNV